MNLIIKNNFNNAYKRDFILTINNNERASASE